MIVGALTIDLAVYGSQSLKDKRRVVKSLKDRLTARFNASVAEVGALDSRKRAVLGVAVVGNESAHVDRCLDKIVEFVERHHEASLIDYRREKY